MPPWCSSSVLVGRDLDPEEEEDLLSSLFGKVRVRNEVLDVDKVK